MDTATVLTTDTASGARRRRAFAAVDALRADLHHLADEGALNDEVGYGVLVAHVHANAALPAAGALVFTIRERTDAARRDRTATGPDCRNPWGLPGVPSCEESDLQRMEIRAAAQLADKLVNGPWPIY